VAWLPDDFFIGYPEVASSGHRPLGQGDIIDRVPLVTNTAVRDGQAGLKASVSTAIVVASSCGMRKQGGELNAVVHVAPVRRLSSLAPGWSAPWEGWLHVLPLPGLYLDDERSALAADLGRIGLCGSEALQIPARRASVSLNGMRVLKWRLASYFARVPLLESLFEVGARTEWCELDLWELWAGVSGSPDGFQRWLDETNPDYPSRSRRSTIYDDFAGLQQQLREFRASEPG
jgi:hypothetical protein